MASEGSQAARKRVRLERGLYLRSDGKYEAKFVVDGRDRSRTLRATTKTAARQERAELLVKLGRGERVFADDPTKTLGHLAEEWLETLNVRPRTREAYAYHLERNVLPYFGRKRRPSEITPQRVAAFVAHLRDERKL